MKKHSQPNFIMKIRPVNLNKFVTIGKDDSLWNINSELSENLFWYRIITEKSLYTSFSATKFEQWFVTLLSLDKVDTHNLLVGVGSNGA
jgi:hypothetical protein